MIEEAFSVRSYAPSDRAAVIALWQESFPEEPPWSDPADVIDRKQAVQPELFLVGCYEGRLVASVLAGFDGVRGWVHDLAVAPGQRRRGYAGRMMDAAESALTALGCPKLNLQVRSSNEAVVAFYRSRGYAVEERISLGKRLGRWRSEAS